MSVEPSAPLIRIHARRAVGDLFLVVDEAAGLVVVGRHRPELLGGHMGVHAQAIGLAAVEPVAVPVLGRFEVRLPHARHLGGHCRGRGHGLVEPRRIFVQRRRKLGFRAGLETERDLPAPVRPDGRICQALLVRVGTRHRLADQRRFGQEPGLPRIRREGLALLDAQGLEHRHHDAVALPNGLLVDGRGEQFPIGHAAWLGAAPWPAPRRDTSRDRRRRALAVGVDAKLVEQRLACLRVGDQHAKPDEHAGGR